MQIDVMVNQNMKNEDDFYTGPHFLVHCSCFMLSAQILKPKWSKTLILLLLLRIQDYPVLCYCFSWFNFLKFDYKRYNNGRLEFKILILKS